MGAQVMKSDERRVLAGLWVGNGSSRGGREQRRLMLRDKLNELHRHPVSARQLYLEGKKQGDAEAVVGLADILFRIQECGLGRAAVMEESNKHLLIRVLDCSRGEAHSEQSCWFVTGFIEAALRRTGKYASVEVREIECNEGRERASVFRAELRRNI